MAGIFLLILGSFILEARSNGPYYRYSPHKTPPTLPY
jgi:hypothetical protein